MTPSGLATGFSRSRSVRSPTAEAPDCFHSSSFRCLLDLDAELADELDPEVRRVARAAATALTFQADPGQLWLSQWLYGSSRGLGLLVLEGVLSQGVSVGGRLAAELLGAGDLLQPLSPEGEQLLSSAVRWQALVPMRFALLDDAFAKRVRFWPQIGYALLRRAGRRQHDASVQRAIATQPRLEIRLALLFWHLAGRWGKVERGGIRLPLPLTHQLLGRLIGAERPSVTHALARLARAQLITGHGAEWHLHGSLEESLPAMIEPAADRAEEIVASVMARRQR